MNQYKECEQDGINNEWTVVRKDVLSKTGGDEVIVDLKKSINSYDYGKEGVPVVVGSERIRLSNSKGKITLRSERMDEECTFNFNRHFKGEDGLAAWSVIKIGEDRFSLVGVSNKGVCVSQQYRGVTMEVPDQCCDPSGYVFGGVRPVLFTLQKGRIGKGDVRVEEMVVLEGGNIGIKTDKELFEIGFDKRGKMKVSEIEEQGSRVPENLVSFQVDEDGYGRKGL